MRKFLVSLLVVTLAITMFGTVAFAANDYDVYFTEPVIDYENGTATAYLVLAPQANGLFAITFEKAVTGATVRLTDTGALKDIDSSMTLDEMTLFGFTSGDAGISETTTALNIVKFDITRDGDAKTASITITQGEFMDGNGDEATLKIKPLSFSWEKAVTPSVSLGTPTTKKEVTVGDTNYTDVYTCEGNVSVTNLGSKNVKLTPYAKLDGTPHELTSAPTITIPNAQFESGNVAFKFVLIGAPKTGVEFGANYELVD